MPKKLALVLAVTIILLLAEPFALPETPEEIKATAARMLQLFQQFVKKVWQKLLGFLQTSWNWVKINFNSYLRPFFQNIWLKVKSFFVKEFEERKVVISQELEKEKQQIKEGVVSKVLKIPKSLWDKSKTLIR